MPLKIFGNNNLLRLGTRGGGIQVVGGMTYLEKSLSIRRDTILAHWAGNGNALDSSGNGRHGTPTNVTYDTGIGDGGLSFVFDGSTSLVNVYSDSLRDAFNTQEGTISLWFKIDDSAVWTDGAQRRMFYISAAGNNFISMRRSVTNNTFDFIYRATAQSLLQVTPFSSTEWVHVAYTWSKSSDRMKCYVNGVSAGADVTGLGDWVGTLINTNTVLGSIQAPTSAQTWKGRLAHVELRSAVLTANEIASLAIPNGNFAPT